MFNSIVYQMSESYDVPHVYNVRLPLLSTVLFVSNIFVKGLMPYNTRDAIILFRDTDSFSSSNNYYYFLYTK